MTDRSQTRPEPSAVDVARLHSGAVAAAAYLGARVPAIVADLGELLRAELPSSYTPEQLVVLTEHARVIVEIALSNLREGARLQDMDTGALQALARRWADEGWPLDPRGFQLGARHVLSVLAEHAVELGLDDRTLFSMQDRFWAWATTCAAILAEARSDHDIALARRDAARRADFLRELAAGTVTTEQLERESAVYGLDLQQPYFAVCAHCEDPVLSSTLEAHIRRSGATHDHRALPAVVDVRLLAVTPAPPAALAGTLIAVGAARALGDLHSSFAEATKTLATARAVNLTGLVDLGALGPRPLIIEADTLARTLESRHFGALERGDRSSLAVEETVRTLLELNRNVDAAAQRLNLHRNTVRYRVGRFTELTGLDLGRTEDLVTAWWLLARRHVARAAVHGANQTEARLAGLTDPSLAPENQ